MFTNLHIVHVYRLKKMYLDFNKNSSKFHTKYQYNEV
jgi:hypothetical protein